MTERAHCFREKLPRKRPAPGSRRKQKVQRKRLPVFLSHEEIDRLFKLVYREGER